MPEHIEGVRMCAIHVVCACMFDIINFNRGNTHEHEPPAYVNLSVHIIGPLLLLLSWDIGVLAAWSSCGNAAISGHEVPLLYIYWVLNEIYIFYIYSRLCVPSTRCKFLNYQTQRLASFGRRPLNAHGIWIGIHSIYICRCTSHISCIPVQVYRRYVSR